MKLLLITFISIRFTQDEDILLMMVFLFLIAIHLVLDTLIHTLSMTSSLEVDYQSGVKLYSY